MKITVNFSDNLIGKKGYYAIYYSQTPTGKCWGTASAVLVEAVGGHKLSGIISEKTLNFEIDMLIDVEGFPPYGSREATIVCGNPMVAKPVNLEVELTENLIIDIVAQDDMNFSPRTIKDLFIFSENVDAYWKQGICKTCGDIIRRERNDISDEWWKEDFDIMLKRHKCKNRVTSKI